MCFPLEGATGIRGRKALHSDNDAAWQVIAGVVKWKGRGNSEGTSSDIARSASRRGRSSGSVGVDQGGGEFRELVHASVTQGRARKLAGEGD